MWQHPEHLDPVLKPQVWALPGPGLLLPLYLGTKATASSLSNNQCFMFYTQQMSDHRDHEDTHLGFRRPEGWGSGQGRSASGSCWVWSRCLLPGRNQYLSAVIAPSLSTLTPAPALTGSSHQSLVPSLPPSGGGRPCSWTLVTKPEVGPWPDITTRYQRGVKSEEKDCLYVNYMLPYKTYKRDNNHPQAQRKCLYKYNSP